MIAATGYRTGLQPLLEHIGVLNDSGTPTIHGAQQLDAYPGLWFTGMKPRLPGFFHMAGETAQEIASAIDSEQRHKGFVASDAEIYTTTEITVT